MSTQKTITINGGGALGSSLAITIAEKLEALENTPQISIQIIDPAGTPGVGDPYKPASSDPTLTEILWNNQPNNRMSYNAVEAPDDLCKHIAPDAPDSVKNKFSSRAATGRYVQDKLLTTQERLEQSPDRRIRIDFVQGKTVAIEKQEGKFITTTDNGERLTSDISLVTTGHQKSNLFTQFNQPGIPFYEPNFDLDEIKTRLETTGLDQPVAIIGTSQTFVDSLAMLEALGHKGKIHAFSGRGIMPWAFRPEEHPIENDSKPYQFSVLTPSNAQHATSLDDYLNLFEQEVDNARPQGIGRGIILGRLDLNQLIDAAKTADAQQAAHDFRNFISAYYGNMTPPERFEMIQNLRESGRLQIIKSRLSADTLSWDENHFTIQGQDEQYVACFNGAAYTRTGINPQTNQAYCLVLQNLDEQGALTKSDDGKFFVAGEQQLSGLFLAAGPSTEPKWGMESFCGKNIPIADAIVNEVLECQHNEPN